MLFAEEIDQCNIEDKCDGDRNKNRRVCYASLFSYKELVNQVVSNNNYNYGDDPLFLSHKPGFKV